MKKWLAILMTVAFVSVSQAQVLNAWDYNVPDGGMSTASSTGLADSVSFGDDSNMVSIVGGQVEWAPALGKSGYFKFVEATPYSGKEGGKFQIDLDYTSADFTETFASNGTAKVAFGLRSSAEVTEQFRLAYNGTTNVMVVSEDLVTTNYVDKNEFVLEYGNKYAGLTIPGNILSNNLHVTAVYDLNNTASNDAMVISYTYDGVTSNNAYSTDLPVDFDFHAYRWTVQANNGGTAWQFGDEVYTDNLVITMLEEPSDPPAPPPSVFGTLSIEDSKASSFNKNPTNFTYKTFADAQEGDVVVVLTAANNNVEPDTTDSTGVITFGGTASLSETAFSRASKGGSPSASWYSTVTADGSVDVNLNHATNLFVTVGAYLLRSDTGLIEFLSGVENGEFDAIANTYDFGQASVGLFFEAIAANDTAVAGNMNTIFDVTGSRQVAHGAFSDVASLTNVWTVIAGKRLSSVGLAFAAVAPPTPTELYYDWIGGYSVGSATNMLVDADGDLLDNLSEYAFGGEPDNFAVQGNTPVQSMLNDGGTEYLQYVYFERDDVGDRGLSSILNVGTDLVNTDWTTNGIESVGSGPSAVSGYNAVTNRVPVDGNKKFLRLQIELTP